jgi:hypothetical protein
MYINWLTESPKLHGAALLEKLTVPRLFKFLTVYGTQRFITTLKTAHHSSPSWVKLNQSTPHICKVHLNITLPPIPMSPPAGFPTKITYEFLMSTKPHTSCQSTITDQQNITAHSLDWYRRLLFRRYPTPIYKLIWPSFLIIFLSLSTPKPGYYSHTACDLPSEYAPFTFMLQFYVLLQQC